MLLSVKELVHFTSAPPTTPHLLAEATPHPQVQGGTSCPAALWSWASRARVGRWTPFLAHQWLIFRSHALGSLLKGRWHPQEGSSICIYEWTTPEKSMNMSLRSSKQMCFLLGAWYRAVSLPTGRASEKLLCLDWAPASGQHPGQGPGLHWAPVYPTPIWRGHSQRHRFSGILWMRKSYRKKSSLTSAFPSFLFLIHWLRVHLLSTYCVPVM